MRKWVCLSPNSTVPLWPGLGSPKPLQMIGSRPEEPEALTLWPPLPGRALLTPASPREVGKGMGADATRTAWWETQRLGAEPCKARLPNLGAQPTALDGAPRAGRHQDMAAASGMETYKGIHGFGHCKQVPWCVCLWGQPDWLAGESAF